MLFQVKSYLQYLVTGKTKYRIHSPFVYDFRIHVLDDNIHFYPFKAIEHYRRKLLHDETIIDVKDLGAGSKSRLGNKRSIKQITKTSLKSPKYARMIFRLMNHYEYRNALELGTALGVTTAYMASVNHKAKITTIEGCPQLHKRAVELFEHFELRNIEAINANFDEALPELVKADSLYDFVFIDGNHNLEATIRNFETILPYCTDNATIIIDDIHWSEEMFRAWSEIKANENVKVSISIFELGILIKNDEIKEKEDFEIYY